MVLDMTEMPSLEYKLDALVEALNRIADNNEPNPPALYRIPETFTSQIRYHMQTLVLINDGAATDVNLLIGQFRYFFHVLEGVTEVSFPITIDRGTDVSFDVAAVTGYFVSKSVE